MQENLGSVGRESAGRGIRVGKEEEACLSRKLIAVPRLKSAETRTRHIRGADRGQECLGELVKDDDQATLLICR